MCTWCVKLQFLIFLDSDTFVFLLRSNFMPFETYIHMDVSEP